MIMFCVHYSTGILILGMNGAPHGQDANNFLNLTSAIAAIDGLKKWRPLGPNPTFDYSGTSAGVVSRGRPCLLRKSVMETHHTCEVETCKLWKAR